MSLPASSCLPVGQQDGSVLAKRLRQVRHDHTDVGVCASCKSMLRYVIVSAERKMVWSHIALRSLLYMDKNANVCFVHDINAGPCLSGFGDISSSLIGSRCLLSLLRLLSTQLVAPAASCKAPMLTPACSLICCTTLLACQRSIQ